MNPKHPAWFLLPILGIVAGVVFRPSEDIHLPLPEEMPVEPRLLVMPDGRALRFLKGPAMDVFLSETEVPASWIREIQSDPLTHSEAKDFIQTLSKLTKKPLRLPTVMEWRAAARAGVPSAQYPWGFGPLPPSKTIHFDRNDRPENPGSALGYGFRDMAGGVWEWTEEGILLGSAWSEVNPETLRIDYEWNPPEGYRGSDVGIRLVWE